MESLQQVLMRRDNLTAAEAIEQIQEARDILNSYLADEEYESAHNICEEMFGLEPDYLDDLLYG